MSKGICLRIESYMLAFVLVATLVFFVFLPSQSFADDSGGVKSIGLEDVFSLTYSSDSEGMIEKIGQYTPENNNEYAGDVYLLSFVYGTKLEGISIREDLVTTCY